MSSILRVASRSSLSAVGRRSFQTSPMALAKARKTKAKAVSLSDDLFGNDGGYTEDIEMFTREPSSQSSFSSIHAEESESAPAPVVEKVTHTTRRLKSGVTVRCLTAAARRKRFDERYAWVRDRLGRKPKRRSPQVRDAVWNELFQFANDKDDMMKIVQLMPQWREMDRSFDKSVTKMLIERCTELRCAPLALQVIADRPRYAIELHDLSNVRALLRALYWTEPIRLSLTLSALCGAAGLPPLHSDSVSCAMLTAAALRPPTTKLGSQPAYHPTIPKVKTSSTPPSPAEIKAEDSTTLTADLSPAITTTTSVVPPTLIHPVPLPRRNLSHTYPLTLNPLTFPGPRAPSVAPVSWRLTRPASIRRHQADEHAAAVVLAKDALLPALKNVLTSHLPVLPAKGADGARAVSFVDARLPGGVPRHRVRARVDVPPEAVGETKVGADDTQPSTDAFPVPEGTPVTPTATAAVRVTYPPFKIPRAKGPMLSKSVPNMTARERDWLMWALVRVEMGLQQRHVGEEWGWLRRWRVRNGHVRATGLPGADDVDVGRWTRSEKAKEVLTGTVPKDAEASQIAGV